ncbi:endonuclease/exonuclease/phosphatase family protein [Streptomyces sp. NPDC091272]|uniref:endonuclease/exonuclease/phosphatase family protein n=1 Tax=Streptomyces sp. NPDC091272 TaxID=3365981 RepID=UPI003812A885
MRRSSLFLTVSLATALVVPALLGAASPGAPAPAAEPTALRVMTYNICGASCLAPAGYDDRRRVDVVATQAVEGAWQADQVHLQEVCKDQYDEVLARLAPHGFTGFFTSTENKRVDCRKKDYGVAVLVRAKIQDTLVLDLTQGVEPERIKVPCVRSTSHGVDNWACSVHLYWQEQEPRAAQARALAAQARTWRSQGRPVVLAGDFNASPLTGEMGEFYGGGTVTPGRGQFVEGDERDARYFDRRVCDPARHERCRSGEPTFGNRKLDYVFFSEGDFPRVRADARRLERKVSDHNLLRATADVAGDRA